jgi:hypothetical protein
MSNQDKIAEKYKSYYEKYVTSLIDDKNKLLNDLSIYDHSKFYVANILNSFSSSDKNKKSDKITKINKITKEIEEREKIIKDLSKDLTIEQVDYALKNKLEERSSNFTILDGRSKKRSKKRSMKLSKKRSKKRSIKRSIK